MAEWEELFHGLQARLSYKQPTGSESRVHAGAVHSTASSGLQCMMYWRGVMSFPVLYDPNNMETLIYA